MAPTPQELTISVKAEISELSQVAEQVEAFCERAGIPLTVAFKLNVVIDELFTNAVKYGVFETDDPSVGVSIFRSEDRIQLIVEDNGVPYDPFSEAAVPDIEADLEDRQIGGLGIHIVREMTDEATHEYTDGRNRICLVSSLEA